MAFSAGSSVSPDRPRFLSLRRGSFAKAPLAQPLFSQSLPQASLAQPLFSQSLPQALLAQPLFSQSLPQASLCAAPVLSVGD